MVTESTLEQASAGLANLKSFADEMSNAAHPKKKKSYARPSRKNPDKLAPLLGQDAVSKRTKVLAAPVEEAVHWEFRRIAREKGISVQRAICQAFNLYLAKNNSEVRSEI